MTPKEKAEDIIDKMSKGCDNADFSEIKFCAIVCVNEIILEIDKGRHEGLLTYLNQRQFWIQVKLEIEKL